MSFFRKLFGSKKEPAPASSSAPSSSKAKLPPKKEVFNSSVKASPGEPIKGYDKYGREILIERQDWLDSILLGALEKAMGNPDELAAQLIRAFQDDFFSEVEGAALHLHRTDSDPARGVALLSIIYLQTDRPADAERILSEHLKKHGDDGVVLTNLAKAQSVQGRDEESLKTLWYGLECDPNQDNGLGWYEVIHREKGGREASLDALRRVAALPGSWRAQLWIARDALEQRDLDSALDLYRQTLDTAARPVPTDLLMQMSGDLGNHGHLMELIEVTAPHFDLELHGLTIGNNLIKAYLDTGQLDQTRNILRSLQTQQRPDWAEHLGFWETELAKSNCETEQPHAEEELRATLLTIPGPLWLKQDHTLADLFPTKGKNAPHIAFTGSSYESVKPHTEVTVQPSDNPGRMSRALPLFLSEQVYLNTIARTTTIIPWILNGNGGFILSGRASEDDEIASYVRNATGNEAPAADFVVNSHLITQGENWTAKLRVIRTIDAKCLADFSYGFAENAFHTTAHRAIEDIQSALAEEAGAVGKSARLSGLTPPVAQELDHYLFRSEQGLAVRCLAMEGTSGAFLSNPAEIIGGMIHLCLQNPEHLPSRVLLIQSLKNLYKHDPTLVQSFHQKFSSLQSEFPLDAQVQELLAQDMVGIMV